MARFDYSSCLLLVIIFVEIVLGVCALVKDATKV